MTQFRLAIVDSCRETGCLELQQLVPDEQDQPHWIHYVIVRDREQAIKTVAQVEPSLVADAERDLADSPILDSAMDRTAEARMAKHLRGWGKAAEEYRARLKPVEAPAEPVPTLRQPVDAAVRATINERS